MSALAVETRPATAVPTAGRPAVFRRDVQGLRAIAVALVVAFHAGVPFLPGGFVGVDAFFVVSGFLITGLLVRECERTGRVRFAAFYGRRARRLLPASTLVLLSTLLAMHAVTSPARAAAIDRDGLWAALFAGNLRFAHLSADYFQRAVPASPLLHLWSLGVEEQFYLVWPLLLTGLVVIGTRRTLRRRVGLGAALVLLGSFAYSAVQGTAPGAYYSPFTRAWELAAGALVAVVAPAVHRLPRRLAAPTAWAGMALLLGGAFSLSSDTPFPGTAAAVPVLGTALILLGGTAQPRFGPERLLRLPAFQGLGAISYSLYLWHWPVMMFAKARFGPQLTPTATLEAIGLALVFGTMSYVFIEQPVRQLPRLRASSRASLAFGALLTVTSCALTVPATAEGIGPAPVVVPASSRGDVVAAVSAGARLRQRPDRLVPDVRSSLFDDGPAFVDGCLVGVAATQPHAGCAYGDTGAARTLVLYGDSHAAMWLPAFAELGRQRHWRVVLIAKMGCPPAEITVWSVERLRAYRECDAFRRNALSRIAELRPAVVVVTSNGATSVVLGGRHLPYGFSDAWRAGLTTTLQELSRHVKRVVVLGDIPHLLRDPSDCLFQHRSDLRRCGVAAKDGIDGPQQSAERDAAAAAGAEYVDVLPLLCTASWCPIVVDGYVVYRDAFHLTEAYGRYLEQVVGTSLQL